jgi:beta-lactamase class A
MGKFFTQQEELLGEGGRLGVSVYLLNAYGEIEASKTYNDTLCMPMASTCKVAIALTVHYLLWKFEGVSLDTVLTVHRGEFSPGHPSSTLDRYFFNPLASAQQKTIGELIFFMLTESDNTATDKLLQWIGGPSVVNNLMHEYGFEHYNLTRPIKRLLADYYGMSAESTMKGIFQTMHRFLSAYSLNDNEKVMFALDKDSCTPKTMTDFLKFLAHHKNKENEDWLSIAAKHISETMQQCKTGNNMIKKATKNYQHQIEEFGDKSGGLGGIRADIAEILLKDGRLILMSIYTKYSPQELKAREEVIANVASKILNKFLQPDIPKQNSLESALYITM